MSLTPDEIPEAFSQEYQQLWDKIKQSADLRSTEDLKKIIDRFKILNSQIQNLILDMEHLSVNLDQESPFQLSQKQEQEIEEFYQLDRNLDLLKPFVCLVSLMSGLEEFGNSPHYTTGQSKKLT